MATSPMKPVTVTSSTVHVNARYYLMALTLARLRPSEEAPIRCPSRERGETRERGTAAQLPQNSLVIFSSLNS